MLRSILLTLGSLWLTSPLVAAQTVDLTGFQRFELGDGTSEGVWKINNPSAAADWFSVDFAADLDGAHAAALVVDHHVTGANGGTHTLGLTTTNGLGLPDLTAALTVTVLSQPGDSIGTDIGYAIPCTPLGTDLHVVFQHGAGDTEVWLAADTDGPLLGRSYFSSDSYTTAMPASFNWRLGIAGYGANVEGTLLLNGGSSATITNVDDVCLTFSGCGPGIGTALYLSSPVLFGPLLPTAVTTTGAGKGGGCDWQWGLCTTLDCSIPAPGPLGLSVLYADPCDLKPFNGRPRVKFSPAASLTIDPDPSCATGCFGQKDDGIADFYIWALQNPAGTGDWFNVNHGAPVPGSGVTTLTGVQASSWDFCGNGPCWAEIGVYADLSGVPDVFGTVARSTAANPCMAPGSADSGPYPMTVYDIPDIPVGSAAGWHVAANWKNGDSCVWMGSDTDGTDSSCGVPAPNLNADSGFSSNNYASGVVGFTTGNWCMKIDWN